MRRDYEHIKDKEFREKHIKISPESGMSQREYCQEKGLKRGEEAARKHPVNQMAVRLQRHADEYTKMAYQGSYG